MHTPLEFGSLFYMFSTYHFLPFQCDPPDLSNLQFNWIPLPLQREISVGCSTPVGNQHTAGWGRQKNGAALGCCGHTERRERDGQPVAGENPREITSRAGGESWPKLLRTVAEKI